VHQTTKQQKPDSLISGDVVISVIPVDQHSLDTGDNLIADSQLPIIGQERNERVYC